MSSSEIKKNKELRREVEMLRAQLKSGGLIDVSHKKRANSDSLSQTSENIVIDDALLIKDFLKTIVLSACAFAVIITLWVTKASFLGL